MGGIALFPSAPARSSRASPGPHRSLPVVPPLVERRYYGEAPVGLAGGAGAELEELGARGSATWGAEIGSEESPRYVKAAIGESRGTAWRLILQDSPVTLPSESETGICQERYLAGSSLRCRTRFSNARAVAIAGRLQLPHFEL